MKKIMIFQLLLAFLPNALHAEVSVVLSFVPPKTRVDGTVLTPEEIAGLTYTIYVGNKSKQYSYITKLTMLSKEGDKLVNERTVPFSPEEDIYFAIICTDTNGLSSEKSDEVVRKGKVKLLPPGIPEIIGQITDEIIYAAFLDEDEISLDHQNKFAYMSEELIVMTENLYNNQYQIMGYQLNGEHYEVKVK